MKVAMKIQFYCQSAVKYIVIRKPDSGIFLKHPSFACGFGDLLQI